MTIIFIYLKGYGTIFDFPKYLFIIFIILLI